ncbi:meiosis-specific protein ASY3 [Cornus florida]|uniref:meiosis-specific protein ASY3 n=1 Tax=Cornus florida TaxID=4283 RepID=UPI00289BAB1D|nr:meiosis-specific protein ASY3 [Cornus florida]
MEISRQQNLRDDRVSDVRSFGSNYHPCSQSRKISIGVMVDSSVETGPKTTMEDLAAVANAEKLTLRQGKSREDRNNWEEVRAAVIGRQTDAPEQVTSPWVSTKTSFPEKPNLEAVHYARPTSKLPITSGMHNTCDEAKAAPSSYAVQFFANQMSVDDKQKKFSRVTYREERAKDLSAKRVGEFSFATVQEVFVPENEVVEGKTSRTENRSNESLRMKLWDILGTVSSPKKQFSNSQSPEVGAINPEQNIDQTSNPVVKPGQNSDTIESDSENPENTTMRPVTRSLSQKRSSSKVQLNKAKNVPPSTYKQTRLEKNDFSFESGRSFVDTHGVSSMSQRKKSRRKGFSIEPRNIFFHQKDNADDIQQASDRSKGTKSAEKTSSLGNKAGGVQICAPKKDSVFVEPKHGIQTTDAPKSPMVNMTDNLGDINSPILSGHQDQQEDFTYPSLKNIVDRQSDFKTTTFEMRAPTKTSSPGSLPKTNQRELDDCSPAERVFNMEGIRSFNSFLASKPDYHEINVETGSSEDAGELENSPVMKPVPTLGEKDADNMLFKSLSEERDSGSPEEGSPIDEGYNHIEENDAENMLSKSSFEERDSESHEEGSPVNEGCWQTEILLPEFATAEKPKFLFHRSKRLRSEECTKPNDFTPTLLSPKGDKSNGFKGLSEQNQEDGLASAIGLFAMALERVKLKMKSVTSKKSAEILMSVAEGIHSQLHNAESQIQTDLGKLSSLCKSKRKRLDTRFQEQQEQLRIINEKFKEEVSQHIQDCRSAVEGVEAQRMEFKGTVDKQKSSHLKLLLQAEEAIETQLNDAQRRVMAVHKLAREKMLQLKYVIAECLKEGILS